MMSTSNSGDAVSFEGKGIPCEYCLPGAGTLSWMAPELRSSPWVQGASYFRLRRINAKPPRANNDSVAGSGAAQTSVIGEAVAAAPS